MSTQFSFEKEDLLSNLSELQELRLANQGRRFANLLIDYATSIAFGFIVVIILSATLGLFLGLGLLDEAEDIIEDLSALVMYIGMLAYYTLSEGLLKGRTVGKYITGTKAVKEDGSPITLKDAFLRTLCRMVPFEVFSGFDTMTWHDRWTKTRVVMK